MNAKTKFDEIVSEFKKEVQKSVECAINDIHSELVPYVNDDTEFNAIQRAHRLVSSILTSNFTLEGDEIICNGWNTKLTNNDHDRLVNKLAEKCSDKAAQLKIERLERQLKEAYSRNY